MGYAMDIIQFMHKQINLKIPFCKFHPSKITTYMVLWYTAVRMYFAAGLPCKGYCQVLLLTNACEQGAWRAISEEVSTSIVKKI